MNQINKLRNEKGEVTTENAEIQMEIENFLGKNDNENTTTENLWDAGKAVLRGKFVAIRP